jgi:hypothetical protein
MQWENLFADLENQLAAQVEADRTALATEAERLRISRLSLAERLQAIAEHTRSVRLELGGQQSLVGTISDCGIDWVSLQTQHRMHLVPLAAIKAIGVGLPALRESLNATTAPSQVRERITLGFVLRDLARRRLPVTVAVAALGVVHGTIDRAGLDHLDLALHETTEPRRSDEVYGYRVIPLPSVQWVASA